MENCCAGRCIAQVYRTAAQKVYSSRKWLLLWEHGAIVSCLAVPSVVLPVPDSPFPALSGPTPPPRPDPIRDPHGNCTRLAGRIIKIEALP